MQRKRMMTCGMSDVDTTDHLREEENTDVCNGD